jgi:hypothetical protein
MLEAMAEVLLCRWSDRGQKKSRQMAALVNESGIPDDRGKPKAKKMPPLAAALGLLGPVHDLGGHADSGIEVWLGLGGVHIGSPPAVQVKT